MYSKNMILTRTVLVAASALLPGAFLATCPATAAPPAMPIISQGVPAYASDNSGSAGLANNSNYDDNWRSSRTPSTNQPCWLAYDLSSKPHGQVVVTWYNTSNYGYNVTLQGGAAYNLPQNYVLEVNSAPGGAVPSSGWVTRQTVTGNDYHSRTAVFDMSGYNWVRLRCTSVLGSNQNMDVSCNMDVFDARNGAQDTWLFLGDSITAGGMVQSGTTFSQAVRAGNGAYYPSEENGGLGGWTTSGVMGKLNQFLNVSPARYITLSLGTNDINTYAGDTNAVNTAYNNLASMANTVLSSGRVPIIPHVPWARNASIQANAPALNSKIDALCASNPNILLGPDLYGYFNSNQSLISSDNLHPTSSGYQSYRNVWANWALSKVHTSSGQAIANGTYKLASRNNPNMYMEAYYAATGDGTVVNQYTYNGGNTQKWNVTYLGNNQYSIINVNANKPLDVTGSGGSGTFTELWTNYSANNQKWVITPTDGGWYRVSPVHNTSLALDVYGAFTGVYNPGSTGNNGRIQVYNWSGGYNQQWAFWAP